jgi:hypothetical protein
MISPYTLELITALLAKTRAGEATWTEPNDLFALSFRAFVRLSLPHSSVSIGLLPSEAIQFRVHNDSGTAVIDETASPGELGYPPLSELLNFVIRKTRKIDETMNELNAFLGRLSPRK